MSRHRAVVLAAVVVAVAGCDRTEPPALAKIDYDGEVTDDPALPTPSGATGDDWSCRTSALYECTEPIDVGDEDDYCATLFELGLEAHPSISEQWGMGGNVCAGFHNGWWYRVIRNHAGDAVSVSVNRYETLVKFLEAIKDDE